MAPKAGSGFVQISYSGIDRYRDALRGLNGALQNPDMSAPVRGAGKVWEINYHAEGRFGMAGRPWQALSPYTNYVRKQRGYPQAHPILRQSGSLFTAATQWPQQFRGKSMNRSIGTPPTLLTIRTSKNRANLTIVGHKVSNQHGGITPEGFVLPARPFWGISPQVRRWAADELIGTTEKYLERFSSWK